VFLADNHAECFSWIARRFDLDEPHLLVLVDAHSDATAAERSDDIREQLRRVADASGRADRVERWLVGGRVQAFDWLEPLMPRPVARVMWIAKPEPDPAVFEALTGEAVARLDGRLEVEPRSAGSFTGRWKTSSLRELADWQPGGRAIILTIDLDFFSGMPDAGAQFENLWKTAMGWPGLEGVSFAISRPWLRDDAEADAFVFMALDAVRRTCGAHVECDLSVDDRPDNSLRARELVMADRKVPRWDISAASPKLRTLFARHAAEWDCRDRKRKPGTELWGIPPRPRLAADGLQPDCDGVWRFPASSPPVLRLHVPADPVATGRVCWYARRSALPAYDLLPETGLGKGFSKHSGRRIYEIRTPIAETTDFALAALPWSRLLEGPDGCGRIVVEVEYETPTGWLPGGEIELRGILGAPGSFRAGLSECFGMPYVFGIALQRDRAGRTGVDTGWGADCSNFLAHAWRRSGVRIGWGDPFRVSAQLETIAEHAKPADRLPLDPDAVRRGVAVSFGTHMAALWEDREPLERLDASDIMVHHLGGRPELVPLGKLFAERGAFSLLAPRRGGLARMAVAGDVVPVGDFSDHIARLRRKTAGSDLLVANLEGIPTDQFDEKPPAPLRYDFRFDPKMIRSLSAAGIGVVSLANNHAGDAGPDAVAAARTLLENAGIGVVGAGRNISEALRPWRGKIGGRPVAIFGVSTVGGPPAGPESPGILRLPDHTPSLARAMSAARQRSEAIVVLVHWGEEYTESVTDNQRRQALWLAEHGASVVAGSGPHVVQRTDIHAGCFIAYSLGNAVFPRRLRGSGAGAVARIRLDPPGSVQCELRPME